MKLGEYSFREVADRYLLLTDPDLVAMAAQNFLMEEPTNGLLTYCYISHDEGICLEWICFVQQVEDCPIFYPAIIADPPMQITFSQVRESEVVVVDESQWDISSFSPVRTRLQEGYKALFPQVLDTRTIVELDTLRSPDFPDDIRVIFVKEGCQPEGSWLRLEEVVEGGRLEGTILLPPLQDFGHPLNSTAQGVLTQQEGEYFCIIPC